MGGIMIATTSSSATELFTTKSEPMGQRRTSNRRRSLLLTMLAATAPMFFGTTAFAMDYLNVSVKYILSATGQRSSGAYSTDASIVQVMAGANQVLASNNASFRLYLDEIVDVAGLSTYFDLDTADQDTLENLVRNSGIYGWRSDCINFYVVNTLSSSAGALGGACSFPMSHEIITINNQGILNGPVGWLHEIGHYLSLTHTFESCHLPGSPDSDPDVCTEAGATHTGFCGDVQVRADVCDDQINVMSYHSFNFASGDLTSCQLSHMQNEYMTLSRTAVVSVDDGFEPNDTCAAGVIIGAGVYANLVSTTDKLDWYRVSVPSGATLSVVVDSNPLFGSAVAAAFSSCPLTVPPLSTPGVWSQSLSQTAGGGAQEFQVAVSPTSDSDGRSEYTMTLSIAGATCDMPFVRGDLNGDNSIQVIDAIIGLEFLFLAGALECRDAADFNDDGQVQILDIISELTYLFLGGAAPAPPGLVCGPDPSADSIDCCVGCP
mgnify:FL=1